MEYWVEYINEKTRKKTDRVILKGAKSIYDARRIVLNKIEGSRMNLQGVIYAGKNSKTPIGALYYDDNYYGYIWTCWDKKYKRLGSWYNLAWKNGGISEKLEW